MQNINIPHTLDFRSWQIDEHPRPSVLGRLTCRKGISAIELIGIFWMLVLGFILSILLLAIDQKEFSIATLVAGLAGTATFALMKTRELRALRHLPNSILEVAIDGRCKIYDENFTMDSKISKVLRFKTISPKFGWHRSESITTLYDLDLVANDQVYQLIRCQDKRCIKHAKRLADLFEWPLFETVEHMDLG